MKVALPFSGGIDSTAALFLLIENGHSVYPITLDYGQKCGLEIEHAARIANFLSTRIHKETILGEFPKSARIDPALDLPKCGNELEAAEECSVPGLYFQIISSTLRHAISNKCDAICLPFSLAASQFYPEFDEIGLRASALVINQGSGGKIKAIIPFNNSSKMTLLQMLDAANAPYWMTYSCMTGEEDCDDCPKCVIRKSLLEELIYRHPVKPEG